MSVSCDGWSNVPHTGDRTCRCGSWQQHWINFADKGKVWPKKCCVYGCGNDADRGLHIHQGNGPEYIIPGCRSCNGRSSDDKFSIKPGTHLVSANKSKTCEA